MTDFEISPFVAGSAWAGFPSTTPHIARNKHGTFRSVQTAVDPVAYQANTLKVFWTRPDGVTVELPSSLPDGSRVSASQAPAVEALESGEVFAIWSNFSGGGIVIERWPNVAVNPVPIRTIINGAGTANGKFTTEIDEARRCIYFLGLAGWYVVIDCDTGLEVLRQQLFATPTAHYQELILDEDGKLYAAWGTADSNGGGTNYDAIMCAMCPNPRPRVGSPLWTATAWDKFQWLTLPIVPDEQGPAMWALSGEQTSSMSQLLIGAHIADGDRMFVLYAQASAPSGTRLGRGTLGITGLHWRDGAIAITLATQTTKRPLRGREIVPRAASGAIVERASGLYVISHDADHNLVALRSTDGGKNWRDFARTRVPGDPSHTLHYVSTYAGHEDDADIIGMVVDQGMTVAQWEASGNIPTHQTAVYTWRLGV